ncbi:MAG: 3-phosphoshikimate 1-carboxyvinyltransferase [Thermoplasmata archaeon]|nr:3-phosphoshikimate 1-carboxyvinyltransferase [Thermoplasmata archaeon]
MRALVRPSVLRGTIRAPPSKSYTHRELLAGFLARGRSTLVRPSLSVDAAATREGLRRLGARYGTGARTWELTRAPPVGTAGPPARIECGRSGTTLRFLTAVAALYDREVTLTGHRELAARPLEPLLGVLESAGARVHRSSEGRAVPLRIRGPIQPVRADLDSSESSQFLSALLFVLPVLEGASEIRTRRGLVSRPYVAATCHVLRAHGVHVAVKGASYRIPGGQRYRGGRVTIPGDASSAAYLWAAAAVSGGSVRVTGLPRGPPQADFRLLEILRRMGAKVVRGNDGARVEGRRLRGLEVDLTDTPDLYPLVGVLGALAQGSTRIVGAAHVQRKESDRRRATADLARALGARVQLRTDSVAIQRGDRVTPFRASRLSDHRIVMSAAVAALAVGEGSLIGDSRSVAKSYPGFWADLKALGASIRFSRT